MKNDDLLTEHTTFTTSRVDIRIAVSMSLSLGRYPNSIPSEETSYSLKYTETRISIFQKELDIRQTKINKVQQSGKSV